MPLVYGIAIRANDRKSLGGGRAFGQARGDPTAGNLTMLGATPCPQSKQHASFFVPCKARFFYGQLFGEILKQTLGFDRAFVFANQFGDDFDLSLDLRVKPLNTRTAPGHAPARSVAVQRKEVGSGSPRLGTPQTLNKGLPGGFGPKERVK